MPVKCKQTGSLFEFINKTSNSLQWRYQKEKLNQSYESWKSN